MKLAFSRWFFNQIHSRYLIYNQCWEDPAIDNEVLNIGPDDRLVMITSAGCNALDYLYRPGSKTCDFIPGFATSRLQLHPWITEYLNTRDRVGTYASFHFAKVN